MTWLPAAGPGAHPFERAFALRPDLYAAWREFAVLFFERGLLDAQLLELCRLRIGHLHGAGLPDLCEAMSRAREQLDPTRREAVEHWWESDVYSPGERACLRFAEQFVLDARSISDAEAAAVTAALGDAGTVALVEWLALLDGFCRFARFLDLGETGEAAA